MTHSIKDKYESWWFREGQGKGPSAENKEEEKAKKKIPKKRAFTYSCIYIQLGLKPMIERMTELSIWLTRFKIAQKVV